HESVHTKRKGWFCGECGTGFTRRDALRRHGRVRGCGGGGGVEEGDDGEGGGSSSIGGGGTGGVGGGGGGSSSSSSSSVALDPKSVGLPSGTFPPSAGRKKKLVVGGDGGGESPTVKAKGVSGRKKKE
ncbi:hypothetical protein HDV00_005160, partial [Rhizophlyctis rosea]